MGASPSTIRIANQTLPDAFRARFAGDPYAGAIGIRGRTGGPCPLDRSDQRRTAIVVAGDHGESLGDHGEEEHGIFFSTRARRNVPPIIRAPQIDPHRVVRAGSAVTTSRSTILDLDAPEAPGGSDGRSLSAAASDRGALPERVVYAESMHARRFAGVPFGCSATSVSS